MRCCLHLLHPRATRFIRPTNRWKQGLIAQLQSRIKEVFALGQYKTIPLFLILRQRIKVNASHEAAEPDDTVDGFERRVLSQLTLRRHVSKQYTILRIGTGRSSLLTSYVCFVHSSSSWAIYPEPDRIDARDHGGLIADGAGIQPLTPLEEEVVRACKVIAEHVRMPVPRQNSAYLLLPLDALGAILHHLFL